MAVLLLRRSVPAAWARRTRRCPPRTGRCDPPRDEHRAARERDAVLVVRRRPLLPHRLRAVAEHRTAVELLRVAFYRKNLHRSFQPFDYWGLIPTALISLPSLSVSFRTCSANSSGVPPTPVPPREGMPFVTAGDDSALLISAFNRSTISRGRRCRHRKTGPARDLVARQTRLVERRQLGHDRRSLERGDREGTHPPGAHERQHRRHVVAEDVDLPADDVRNRLLCALCRARERSRYRSCS